MRTFVLVNAAKSLSCAAAVGQDLLDADSYRRRWAPRIAAAGAAVLIAALASATDVSIAQEGPDEQPIYSDVGREQAAWCGTWLPCAFVLRYMETGVRTQRFLNRLGQNSADDAVTADEVFEAAEPEPSSSQGLRDYIDAARQRVRAVFGGETPPQGATVDGTYYEGGFDGSRNGTGVAISPQGVLSRGEFTNGRLNGAGQSVTMDGQISAGNFSDNVLSGAGASQDPSGEVIAGTFDDGHPVGYAVHTYPDGSTQRVLYDNEGDELARGERVPLGGDSVNPADPREAAAQAPAAASAQLAPLAAQCGSQRSALASAGGDPSTFEGEVWDGLDAASAADLRQTLDGFGARPPENAGQRYEQCLYQARLAQLDAAGYSSSLNLSNSCQSERLTALTAFFGASPTSAQRNMFEGQVEARGLNGDLATVQQGWKDFSTASATTAQQRAGNTYSACMFRSRLLQLDPSTNFTALSADAQVEATDRLFANLPTRGASPGTDMLRDSVDPSRRAARDSERAQREQAALQERERRQANNAAFWDTFAQLAVVGVQVYADYETQRQAAEAAAAQPAAPTRPQQPGRDVCVLRDDC